MTTIAVADLTQATLEGQGIFDVLMRANKAHLEAEFDKNRIKGSEYATVYLGSLTQVMQTALQFLLAKEKTDLEAQLLQKQIELATVQVQKTNAELEQIEAQTLLVSQQRSNLIAEAFNIPKQGALIDAQKDVQVSNKAQVDAQTQLTDQQKTNLISEGLNIPKQGALIDANKAQAEQQTVNLVSQKAQVEAQTLLVGQQRTNLTAEALNIPKQGQLIDAQAAVQTQERLNLISEELGIDARTDLTIQQKINAITENTVLIAQECKLRAEFDLIMANVLKSNQETALLTQKVATERAQVTALGVDDNSVVGKQKLLYQAQTDGFKRDAEQKAAKLMVDTWNVRRTTDEATIAGAGAGGVDNRLGDIDVGRAVAKLLAGVQA